MTDPVALALGLLTARGRERRRRDSSRSLSTRERSRSLDRSRSRRVAFALRETGHNPRIDTAFDVPGRGLLTTTGRADSVCVPLLAGEVAVTVRGHAILLVALVIARSHGREDGEPDVSSRSVWRRLLSLRRLLQ